MSFATQYSLAHDGAFLLRVEQALVNVAIDVQAENEVGLAIPAGSTLTEQLLHDKRSTFANKVLLDPVGYTKLMVSGVASNETITINSVDGDIEFQVAAIWNAYALP